MMSDLLTVLGVFGGILLVFGAVWLLVEYEPHPRRCVGIIGRLFGHNFSVDFCERCGRRHD